MPDSFPPVLHHGPLSPPLVGRAREQALLHEHLAAALAGRGSIVLIGGEAGIGKTALALDVGQAAAEHDALVLAGHCYDLTETPPYGPWLDAFARYPAGNALPPLPAPFAERGRLGVVASQEALFGQVRDFLSTVTAARPLTLLLDDLHWSDPASLDLLRLVARDLAARPLLLLVTYRDDELPPDHPLAILVPRLVREAHAARLDLRPLDEMAARALVLARFTLIDPDLARLVAYLQTRAEGNPFYLGELLRSLLEGQLLRATDGGWALGDLAAAPVPPLLRQVVAERAARLGGAAQRLLALAAVIGQEVPLALWGAVGEVAEDALLDVVERTVEAHLLVAAPDGRRVRFVHALAREALYEGLLPPRRRAWHQRVGEALAALPQPDPDAVAYHFQQAGDLRAVDWLLQAGEQAQRAYAFLSAAESFAVALRLLPETPAHARDRCWLLLQLAWLRRFVDPWQGIALCDDAFHLATAHGDPTLIARALSGRGILRQRTGDCRRGMADLLAAAEMFADLGDQRQEAPPFAVMQSWVVQGGGLPALQLAMIGQYNAVLAQEDWPGPRRAAQGGAQGVAWSDGTSEGQAFAHAALGDPRAARREFARFYEQARENGHHFALAVGLADELNAVLLPYAADHPAECRDQAAAAMAAWQRASTVQEEQLPPLPYLPLQFLAGNWDAVRAAAPALVGGRVVDWQRHQFGIVGALAAARGDDALLDQLLRVGLPDGPATEPGTCWIIPALALQRLAAARALDLGDHALARAWQAAHDRWLAWSGTVQGLAEGLLGWAAYYRAAGDPVLARERAEQALAQASAPRQPLALLAAHRFLGEVDTSAGRYADAQAHLATALALADACAASYERALTLLALAERDYAAGNHTAALASLEVARVILAPLKATPALARADRLAARLACLKPAAPTYPCGLTVREGEVLRLLAAGQSNREIAAALFVSPRTVERHLATIYRKIEARNRTEASAFAFRHYLT